MDQRSLFGLKEHLERLFEVGDPLEGSKRRWIPNIFGPGCLRGWDMATAQKTTDRPTILSRCSRACP